MRRQKRKRLWKRARQHLRPRLVRVHRTQSEAPHPGRLRRRTLPAQLVHLEEMHLRLVWVREKVVAPSRPHAPPGLPTQHHFRDMQFLLVPAQPQELARGISHGGRHAVARARGAQRPPSASHTWSQHFPVQQQMAICQAQGATQRATSRPGGPRQTRLCVRFSRPRPCRPKGPRLSSVPSGTPRGTPPAACSSSTASPRSRRSSTGCKCLPSPRPSC